MKEFDETEIYNINEAFQSKLKEEAANQRREFKRILLFCLGLFAAGFLTCYLIGI